MLDRSVQSAVARHRGCRIVSDSSPLLEKEAWLDCRARAFAAWCGCRRAHDRVPLYISEVPEERLRRREVGVKETRGDHLPEVVVVGSKLDGELGQRFVLMLKKDRFRTEPDHCLLCAESPLCIQAPVTVTDIAKAIDPAPRPQAKHAVQLRDGARRAMDPP